MWFCIHLFQCDMYNLGCPRPKAKNVPKMNCPFPWYYFAMSSNLYEKGIDYDIDIIQASYAHLVVWLLKVDVANWDSRLELVVLLEQCFKTLVTLLKIDF
jgi:hypothetical protein